MLEDLTINLVTGMDKVTRLLSTWFDRHLVNILAILIGAWLLRRFGIGIVSRLLQRTVRSDIYPTKADREKRIRTLNRLVSAGMRIGVYLLAAILIIGEINPSYTTALFASAGLITVALGFGAQSMIKDFVSGIFIISENQYRVGDVVEIGGVSGTVEDVTIRTTILRDMDGNVHHVPNGVIQVTTNKTIGYSNINEDIVVSLDTDIDRLEHIINHLGEELAAKPEFKSKILEPPHFASIRGYGQTGLVIKITGKTSAGSKWNVRSEMYRDLHKAFDKYKIKIISLPTPGAPAKSKSK
jgi:small conductance mechanosensitive channel